MVMLTIAAALRTEPVSASASMKAFCRFGCPAVVALGLARYGGEVGERGAFGARDRGAVFHQQREANQFLHWKPD